MCISVMYLSLTGNSVCDNTDIIAYFVCKLHVISIILRKMKMRVRYQHKFDRPLITTNT